MGDETIGLNYIPFSYTQRPATKTTKNIYTLHVYNPYNQSQSFRNEERKEFLNIICATPESKVERIKAYWEQSKKH